MSVIVLPTFCDHPLRFRYAACLWAVQQNLDLPVTFSVQSEREQ